MPESRDANLLERARRSLDGLSVGDALGERFFVHPAMASGLIADRALPAPPWHYTDDTEMALSIFAILRECGGIDQDRLARSLAAHYDSMRGYGPAMHRLLPRIAAGADWREAVGALFGGKGSYGNGAAMRVAPVGAYFADDLEAVAEHARRSAAVTHAHPEGIAGAIAVAVAASWAWRLRDTNPLPTVADFLALVLPHLPAGEVSRGVERARSLAPGANVREVVAAVGNGRYVTAQDTVPFALWCAARELGSFEEAIWLTASGLGDVDTTCAIVGGVVALSSRESIPPDWLRDREPLPEWPFGKT